MKISKDVKNKKNENIDDEFNVSVENIIKNPNFFYNSIFLNALNVGLYFWGFGYLLKKIFEKSK